MTIVSMTNLDNAVPMFVRDVLRENLTDTQDPVRTAADWIFKGSTEREFDPPIVFIDEVNPEDVMWNLQGSKTKPVKITLIIRVWASKMANRDALVSEIKNTLKDQTKTDGTDSIRSKYLSFKRIRTKNTSAVVSTYEEPTKIKRVSRLEVLVVYYGA